MAEIILHPGHPDYCKECIFHEQSKGRAKAKITKKTSIM